MEGTNCEYEAYQSFRRSGADPQYVHIKQLEDSSIKLTDFDIIFFPGGFSAGDYVRAGAIFAARVRSASGHDIMSFDDSHRPIIGVCNGFQVMVELGLLPGNAYLEKKVTLTFNSSGRFECRRVFVRLASKNRMIWSAFEGRNAWEVPVAHSEGRVVLDDPEATFANLQNEGNILFQYVDAYGNPAGYPWNPNGSYRNIAALSNSYGNAIGLMPHPERIYYSYQASEKLEPTAGKQFFDAIVAYSRSL
jgi:phosphoribosylformylglycinamidine synthase I